MVVDVLKFVGDGYFWSQKGLMLFPHLSSFLKSDPRSLGDLNVTTNIHTKRPLSEVTLEFPQILGFFNSLSVSPTITGSNVHRVHKIRKGLGVHPIDESQDRNMGLLHGTLREELRVHSGNVLTTQWKETSTMVV